MENIGVYFYAFVTGGILCVIAQVLIDKTKLTPARILVGYVVAGVVLTAVGLYAPLVDIAGAGALTPLTGFGYALANGAREAVDERGLLGALSGGLESTATGISTAIFAGLLASLIFKSKPK